MHPVRIALIGLGKMGTRHLRVLQKMPHLAKICAMFDVDEKKVIQAEEGLPPKIGVKSYEELLDRCPGAVIIATPIETHAALAIEALGKDISVLVEKPMADNIRDAEIMIDMAHEGSSYGTILMVGYTERFNGAIQVLKEKIKDESLIAITTRRAGPYLTPQIKSNIVDTLVTHDIDLVSFLTGADFEDIAAETNGTDFFNATFKLTNGVTGNMEADKLSPFKERIITVWSRGKFWRADLIAQTVRGFRHYRKFGVYTTRVYQQSHIEPLAEELKAFLSAASTGGLPPITGEDGLRAIRVAERCQREGMR